MNNLGDTSSSINSDQMDPTASTAPPHSFLQAMTLTEIEFLESKMKERKEQLLKQSTGGASDPPATANANANATANATANVAVEDVPPPPPVGDDGGDEERGRMRADSIGPEIRRARVMNRAKEERLKKERINNNSSGRRRPGGANVVGSKMFESGKNLGGGGGGNS